MKTSDKKRAQVKEWQNNNPAKVLQYKKNYKKSHAEQIRKYQREYRRMERSMYPERFLRNHRHSHLKIKYKLTPEQYDTMCSAQKGICKICGLPPKRKYLAVDHDHKTGKVRGLLCCNCNTMLAFIEKSLPLTSRINAYLHHDRPENVKEK